MYQVEQRDAGNPPESMGEIMLLWTHPPVLNHMEVMMKIQRWIPYMHRYGTIVISRFEFSHNGILDMVQQDVMLYTNPHDLVVDPFCGTSTTGIAAIVNDRNYYGSDISIDSVDHSLDRLRSYEH